MDETITLATPDGDMGVHIVRPDGDGPYPVIVFFHHGPGLDDGSKEAMQSLADGGYYLISHDRYHREAPWYHLSPDMRNDQAAMTKFWEVLTGTTEDMVDSTSPRCWSTSTPIRPRPPMARRLHRDTASVPVPSW